MRFRFFRTSKYTAVFILIILFAISCGKANVKVFHDVESDYDYPRTVAVLPFSYDSEIIESKRPHAILRQLFFNYFSYLGYTDLPLSVVDLRIASTDKKPNGNIENLSNTDLRQILRADAVIRGHIINATNFTAGIYAETSIKAKLES